MSKHIKKNKKHKKSAVKNRKLSAADGVALGIVFQPERAGAHIQNQRVRIAFAADVVFIGCKVVSAGNKII